MKENKARKEGKPREAVCSSGNCYYNKIPETFNSQEEKVLLTFRVFHPWSLKPATMSLWQDKASLQGTHSRTKLLLTPEKQEKR